MRKKPNHPTGDTLAGVTMKEMLGQWTRRDVFIRTHPQTILLKSGVTIRGEVREIIGRTVPPVFTDSLNRLCDEITAYVLRERNTLISPAPTPSAPPPSSPPPPGH